MRIFTIGVYEKSEEDFFSLLKDNNIDTFCDIRQRRGVRGRKYSFVNSKYLQEKLQSLEINYLYFKELAPTTQIREKQWEDDKTNNLTKKKRLSLGALFSQCYCNEILDTFNFDSMLESFKTLNSQNVVFFCVEANYAACHRSLLAQRLNQMYGYKITNL